MNRLLKNITFITSFAVLILSCQEDYEVKPLLDDSSQTSEIKSLHQANYQNKSAFKDITFDWESLNVSESKNNNTNHIFKSNNFPQQKIFTEEGEIFVNQFLLAEKGDFNVYDYRLVKTFSIQPIKNREFFLDGFTGKIEYYTLKGKLVSVEIYENGNILYFVEGEEIKGLQQMEQLRFGYCPPQHMLSVMSSLDGCGFSGGGGGSWRWVSTHHYTDWYDDRNNNGIAETHEFSHTQYTGITTSLEYVFNNDDTFYEYSAWGGHGGGGGSPLTYGSGTPAQTYENNPAMFECLIENSFAYCDCTENDNNCEDWEQTQEDQWEEENINTDELDPCTTAIVDILKINDQTDIGNALRRFDNTLHDLNLDFFVVDSIPGAAAHTSNTNATNFYIEVSAQTFKECTDIYAAGTILHEIIHAYMGSLVSRSDPSFLGTNTGSIPDIPNTFDGYVQEIISDTTSLSGPDQHDYMANHFVSTMADALYEFDDQQQDYEYYWCLSWGGLYNTKAWKKYDSNQGGTPANNEDEKGQFKYALTQARMEKIVNIDVAEQNNQPNAKGSKHDANGECFN